MSQITPPPSPKQTVWWCCSLRGFRPIASPPGADGIAAFTGLSDGPYAAEGLEKRLLGRVVGYSVRSLGKALSQAAGYENEDIRNAEFDAAEYIDTMTRCGHRLAISRGKYSEFMPERQLTDKEHEEVLAVRWKFVRASQARARVKAECERRGLVE